MKRIPFLIIITILFFSSGCINNVSPMGMVDDWRKAMGANATRGVFITPGITCTDFKDRTLFRYEECVSYCTSTYSECKKGETLKIVIGHDEDQSVIGVKMRVRDLYWDMSLSEIEEYYEYFMALCEYVELDKEVLDWIRSHSVMSKTRPKYSETINNYNVSILLDGRTEREIIEISIDIVLEE